MAASVELEALQAETQQLLDKIREPSRKKTASPFKINTAKKGFDADKTKRNSSKEKDRDVNKTQKLYDSQNISTRRVTVEVLDDGSPDVTPRQDYEAHKQLRMETSQTNAQNMSKLYEQEDNYRYQSFDKEKTRVAKKNDIFVPAPGLTTEDVDAERQRLYRLEESARRQHVYSQQEIGLRTEYLAKDKSAVEIQRVFRGYIGRRRVHLTKKIRDMTHGEVAEWIEVCDKESGQVWYYNTINGSSQWEKPKLLEGKLTKPENKKTLPSVGTKSKKGSTSKSAQQKLLSQSATLPNLRKTSTSPTRTGGMDETGKVKWKDTSDMGGTKGTMGMTGTMGSSNEYERTQIKKELAEAFNVAEVEEGLLAPDGSFKPQLRETIRNALAESRFDSISSVLADKRWIESTRPQQEGPKKLKNTANEVDLSRKPMISMLTFKKPAKGAGVTIDEYDMTGGEGGAANDPRPLNQQELNFVGVDHPGFQAQGQEENERMCFGCWSAGSNKKCHLHLDLKENTRTPGQSMLLCRNWDLSVMRRRYRSEEIQEVFMKKTSSLKYDTQRKKFVSVTEQKHPIYRIMSNLLDSYNNKARLYQKLRKWLFSFAEEVRRGAVKPGRTEEKSKMLRIKRSLMNGGQVTTYTKNVRHLLPIAPTTGYTWPERTGAEQYLFTHPDPSLGEEVQIIVTPPIMAAIKLYEPREYHLPAPKSIPMPRPEYESDEAAHFIPGNVIIDDLHPAAWFEKIAGEVMRNATHDALQQISSLTPPPGLELLRRTKYPDPCTVTFATLGRKPTPGMIAVGGLPMEFLVLQLITTYIPPQYGSLMVTDKSTISPGVSPEVTITFKSLPMEPIIQPYKPRPVEHPLNYRVSPTITVSTKAGIDDKYLYGKNRPEQTGEQESHGFRTTAWAVHLLTQEETNPMTFNLSEEVVSLNIPSSNLPITTHADHTYPFCEPSTRENTTLDFYALLLTGVQSAPKPQIFTAITAQHPGEFQKGSDPNLPLGAVLVSVYRSWAFTQKDTIVEYKSDDGVTYWYHRRTGQTFWERPLLAEEAESPLLGGTQLDPNHAEEPFTLKKGEPSVTRRYNQGEVRKIMLYHHETPEEASRRRREASASSKIARQKGIIPDIVEGMSLFPNGPSKSLVTGSAGVEGMTLSQLPGHNPLQPESSLHQFNATGTRSEMSTRSDKRPSSPAHSEDSRISTESSLPRPQTGFRPNTSQTSTIPEGDQDDASFSQNHPSSPQQQQMAMGFNPAAMNNMTNVLQQLLSTMDLKDKSPQDMMQLGLGMGMAIMQATNMVPQQLSQQQQFPSVLHAAPSLEKTLSYEGDIFMSPPGSPDPHQTQQHQHQQNSRMSTGKSPQRVGLENSTFSATVTTSEPIGIHSAKVDTLKNKMLDHSEEMDQKSRNEQLNRTALTAMENAMELKVAIAASETPDEILDDAKYAKMQALNADEAVRKDHPVLVYPELSSVTEGGPPPDFLTHAPAGIDTSFVLKKDAEAQEFVGGSKILRRVVPKLPVGFYDSIFSKRVAKQHVDYLPHIPNLPQAAAVGRVKPRSAAVDWLAIGFDPWSAGKPPLSTEFIPTLSTKAEQLFDEKKLLEVKRAKEDGIIAVTDAEGLTAQTIEISKQQKQAEDYKKICSLCRHAKFGEVEELMNHPDWNLPIDYQDDTGNSLIHIAAQNGNKRMIKLCLKRGADVNAQNLNGQTPLHFAYSYGYNEVGEYMISKGADDTIRNKDGLTCYEGLSNDAVENL